MDETAVRPAQPHEAETLTALALRSKGHWPYGEDLMAVFRRTIVLTAQDIAEHEVLVHETDGIVDGVALLIVEGADAELDHLWVDPAAMGRGIGRRLFGAMADRARRLGADRIVLNSDPYAEPFYRHLGAVRVGDHPVQEIPGRTIPRLSFTL